ncbi:WGR domain-containing protein [Yinghuangia seranimata]|uniref:WGR domain-containing protein n=1 Tax=Yinghuangia seranimata TaxID=408067 RepID=UPI00248CBEA3|nr:WGR domain-containing protein [Yinghuangia seranimata]MDI2131974.1 WGR domain-containing protein [Yinghuangia seranimata]
MADSTTYLELSEDGGGSHKFYEVVVAGSDVTITYGRIGDPGKATTTPYPTPEKAAAAAAKKAAEKRRKGYEEAVRGVRKRRTVTRRAIPVSSSSSSSTSRRASAAVKRAPVLWKYDSGSAAFGVFVDEHRAMVGNERGDVWTLTHEGEVTNRYQLPDGVKCIVGDESWIYAGCDDGNVYDIGGKAPRVAYEIAENIDIYWLDISDGTLGVSDRNGGITTIDHEDESLWAANGEGTGAWMVRVDGDGVYHGHSAGVEKFSADGTSKWRTRTKGSVLFGWQEKDDVYAGTSGNKVHRIRKNDGVMIATYDCDGSVFSCATAENGRYVFAGDSSASVYCFDESGKRLWKLGTGCGSAFSMQYHDERLYLVTNQGQLACVDVSEAAIHAAEQGTVPQVKDVKLASLDAVRPTTDVETTSDAGTGVVVECVSVGGKARVHVVSAGYHADWNVQFPKNVREVGVRYVVEAVRESAQGGFYRASGEIKKLV